MELTLRCFAERRRDGSWYTHCVDLCLDAEAPTYVEARKKLDDQIILYLSWAAASAVTPKELLRRSGVGFMVRYWRAWLRERLARVIDGLRRASAPAGAPEREFVTHPNLPLRARAHAS